MRNLAFLIVILLYHKPLSAQIIDFSKEWEDSMGTIADFYEFDKNHFADMDLSTKLSNLKSDNDEYSTYIGVFGPNFRRIDFHLNVTKNKNEYLVKGKSKLGENIRDLHGEMRLRKVFLSEQHFISDSLYIGLFDCVMREPGDKDGDGVFSGIFTLVFYIENGEIHIFKSESGDEPSFTNTFVGKWARNGSKVERKVIFSFHPAGLYEKLPFCDEFYTYGENSDNAKIKPEYKKFGWQDFDYYKSKTLWWK